MGSVGSWALCVTNMQEFYPNIQIRSSRFGFVPSYTDSRDVRLAISCDFFQITSDLWASYRSLEIVICQSFLLILNIAISSRLTFLRDKKSG